MKSLKNKKGKWALVAVLALILLLPVGSTQAQIPILDAIKGAVKKVIKAIDLKIQRQQNKVIWLQNAQKVLENEMSKLKLGEIRDWTAKQKELYSNYFEELRKVKSLITYYQRIRDISTRQTQIVKEYQSSWRMLKSDGHFTAEELAYMGRVYSGILEQTTENIETMLLIVSPYKTQMSDAKRLELINLAADRTEQNYTDLQIFTRKNTVLSLQRSKTIQEINAVKQMYGLK